MRISLPQLSASMTHGIVVEWLIPNGGHVETGDDLVEIEVDKADVVLESPTDGVLHIIAFEGEEVPVGSPLADIVRDNG